MIAEVEKLGIGGQVRPATGYLVVVYLVPTDALVYTFAPNELMELSERAIGLVAGGTVTEIRCRALTATLNVTSQSVGEGTVYTTEVNVPILGEQPLLSAWVKRHERRRWLVLARDTLGNCYLAGDKDNGARLSWSQAVTARHSHALVLRSVSEYPAARISTIEPSILFPDREFDYSFEPGFS